MASLRDIYRYVNPGTAGSVGLADTPFSLVNNTEMDDATFYATQMANSAFQRDREWTGQDWVDKWSVKGDSFLDKLNQQYGGVDLSQGPIADNGTSFRLNIDTTKLPQTRFGDVGRTVAVDDNTRLRNPNLVEDHPLYGKITHQMNLRGNNWLGPLLMALTTMGMSSIGAMPSLAISGTRAASTIGRGGDPFSTLSSLALGQLGGLGNLVKTGMSLAQLARRGGG